MCFSMLMTYGKRFHRRHRFVCVFENGFRVAVEAGEEAIFIFHLKTKTSMYDEFDKCNSGRLWNEP